jgi:hypothetical protein
MDVAVMAANVLDRRADAQQAEVALARFMQKDWSIERRAKFLKAAQAFADATEQSLLSAAEVVLQQLAAKEVRTRKRSS